MLFWIIVGSILVALLLRELANRALVRRTARLLESGAPPQRIAEWYESLWKKPEKFREPAQRLIKTSSLPNAKEATRLIQERNAREEQLSSEYGKLLILREGAALRWPPICARCGCDIPSGRASSFTAKDFEYVGYSTGYSTRDAKLDFPVCSNEACRLHPDLKLQRKDPRYTLPMMVGDKTVFGGSIHAHKRFLSEAKKMNAAALSDSL